MKPVYQDLVCSLLNDGYCITKVANGDSMLPTIPSGSLVKVEPAAHRQLKAGQIVLQKAGNNRTIIHRIWRIFPHEHTVYVQTWGDNCRAPDEPVHSSAVLGVVTSLRSNSRWQSINDNALCFLRRLVVLYAPYYLKRTVAKLQKSYLKVSSSTSQPFKRK